MPNHEMNEVLRRYYNRKERKRLENTTITALCLIIAPFAGWIVGYLWAHISYLISGGLS